MKNFNPPLAFYALPFTYFQKSRLKGMKDWAFHGWNEWLVNLLILLYVSGFALGLSLQQFLLGYIAFISFYEIGYIVNDFYAVKKEKDPRLRFGSRAVPRGMLWLWVAVRVLLFLAVTYYVDFAADWLLFYLGLGFVFALHNLLASKALKTFTFLQLAAFRFWAPVFLFVPREVLALLFPVVFFYYVFNRTLTYMDSKNLLQLPERTATDFRLQSGFLLLFFILFWAHFSASWLPVLLAVYFLVFWIIIKVFGNKLSSL